MSSHDFQAYVKDLLADLPNIPAGRQSMAVLNQIAPTDATAVKKLLDLLLLDVGNVVGDMLAKETTTGRYDADRGLIQKDLSGIQHDLSSAVADVVKDLFSDSLPDLTDNSTAPIVSHAAVSWRRVDQELVAIGALISRLDRDLETLAGLEIAFFVELSEMVNSIVSLQVTRAGALGPLSNRDFATSSKKIDNNQKTWPARQTGQMDLDGFYKIVEDRFYVGARVTSRGLHASTIEGLTAQMHQATINKINHATEIELDRLERTHAVGDEILNRSKTILGMQLLENRIKVQLDKMLFGGFFARRDFLRKRIAQDVRELQLRVGAIKDGLKRIFLFAETITFPKTVSEVREWIGSLRRIDAYVSRIISNESPLRLRISFLSERKRAGQGANLSDLLGAAPSLVDLEPFLSLTCGNKGRLRLRGVGAQLEANKQTLWGGTLLVKPPDTMRYGLLQDAGGDQVSEDLPSIPFTMVRTPELPESDTVVVVEPWSNTSGLGKWRMWVEQDSTLAAAIKKGLVEDIYLILDLVWLKD